MMVTMVVVMMMVVAVKMVMMAVVVDGVVMAIAVMSDGGYGVVMAVLAHCESDDYINGPSE